MLNISVSYFTKQSMSNKKHKNKIHTDIDVIHKTKQNQHSVGNARIHKRFISLIIAINGLAEKTKTNERYDKDSIGLKLKINSPSEKEKKHFELTSYQYHPKIMQRIKNQKQVQREYILGTRIWKLSNDDYQPQCQSFTLLVSIQVGRNTMRKKHKSSMLSQVEGP